VFAVAALTAGGAGRPLISLTERHAQGHRCARRRRRDLQAVDGRAHDLQPTPAIGIGALGALGTPAPSSSTDPHAAAVPTRPDADDPAGRGVRVPDRVVDRFADRKREVVHAVRVERRPGSNPPDRRSSQPAAGGSRRKDERQRLDRGRRVTHRTDRDTVGRTGIADDLRQNGAGVGGGTGGATRARSPWAAAQAWGGGGRTRA